MKQQNLFLSYSIANKNLAQNFLENILVLGLGLEVNSILDSRKFLKNKKDTRRISHTNSYKEGLKNASIFVAIITHDYLKDELCRVELGNAWILHEPHNLFLLKLTSIDDENLLPYCKDSGTLNFLDTKELVRLMDLLMESDLSPFSPKMERYMIRIPQFIEGPGIKDLDSDEKRTSPDLLQEPTTNTKWPNKLSGSYEATETGYKGTENYVVLISVESPKASNTEIIISNFYDIASQGINEVIRGTVESKFIFLPNQSIHSLTFSGIGMITKNDQIELYFRVSQSGKDEINRVILTKNH